MAPFKTTAKKNFLISKFFKPSSQQSQSSQPQPSTQEIGEEIVVASPRTRPPATAASASPAPSQTQTTPPKRGPGRPRKYPPSQTSQSDGTNTPKPRGRPRKYPPVSSSPSQASESEVKKSPRPRGRPKKTESQQQRDDQLGGSASSPEPDMNNEEPHVTPTKHSLPLRPSCSPPQQRFSTVAAPSTDIPAPKPPQFGTPADKPPTASFSSISTLTSVPKSSQASGVPVSSSTSSRRVVSDGLQGVTGSDSESEDLEDISAIYAKKRRKLSADSDIKIMGTAPKPPPAKKSVRGSDQDKRKDFFKKFHSPAKPKPKFSLASLVAENEREQISDATIASLESAVEESKKREEQEKQALEEAGFNGEAIIAAAGSDSDERERVIMALARTEALHDQNHFYFFLDPEPSHAKSDFPIDCLPDKPWSKIYRNEISRREACISGFAAELAATHALPMPVTSWMTSQLQYEQSEELCEAYIKIIRASGHHEESISDTWGSLNSIYKTRSLFENNWKQHVKIALPSGLAYMIRLASFRAPTMDGIFTEAPPQCTCAAFLDLALMNVDDLVQESTSLSMSIADCIEEMLDALSEDSFNKLIPLAVATMFSPSDLPELARCQAIAALPASTLRAHRLRRRLALEYFSTEEKKATDPSDWAASIVRTLKTKPIFRTSESTDYSLLSTLITVLDIAIDAGWTHHSLLAPREPTGTWGERAPPTDAETRHNAQIDAISNVLTAMASRIRDAGTSHLRRTETKSLIEQVVARLQFCVRSRVRPKEGVFDDEGNGRVGGGVLRQATLGKGAFGRKEGKVRFDPEPVEVRDETAGEADDEEERSGNGSDALPMDVSKA